MDIEALSVSGSGAALAELDPTDVEVYAGILQYKRLVCEATEGSFQAQVTSRRVAAETNVEKALVALREDLAFMKVVWYNNYWRDLWIFTCNSNPIVALCYSHPRHPISRRMRYLINVVLIGFFCCLGAINLETTECAACEIFRCSAARNESKTTCHVSRGMSHNLTEARTRKGRNPPAPNYCCWISHLKFQYVNSEFAPIGLPLYSMLLSIAFSMTLFQLTMCNCARRSLPDKRRKLEIVARIVIFSILAYFSTQCWFVWHYMHTNDLLWSMMQNFVVVKCMSALGATAFQTFIFTMKWRCQRVEGGTSKFHVSFEDYMQYLEFAGRDATSWAPGGEKLNSIS